MAVFNEYNQRQYQQMSNTIIQFEKGTIQMGQLISNLNTLLYCLENPNQAWFMQFESECATLEAIYAIALDRHKGHTDEDIKKINHSIKILKRMINNTTS